MKKLMILIQKNFPVESGATELLFLQHIEKTLKNGGRAALVVPEGVLFQTNAAYEDVKKKLLTGCNLHTVVSLPAGVVLPYSAVKTSLIFFDKTKRTKDVWFYEVSLHEEKKLTKKAGITEKHFEELLKLAKKRPDTEKSWLVPIAKILESGCNLSAGHYNPHGPEEVELREPEEYALEIKELLHGDPHPGVLIRSSRSGFGECRGAYSEHPLFRPAFKALARPLQKLIDFHLTPVRQRSRNHLA